MAEEFVAACGGTVLLSLGGRQHMAAHPVDGGHLREAIGLLRLPRNGDLVAHADLGRPVGRNDRVGTPPVGPDDPVLFARRRGRDLPTRVVEDADPPMTPHVTVVAKRKPRTDEFHLVTAFYGTPGSPEPHNLKALRSKDERRMALLFWTRNALVWTPDLFVERPFRSTWRRVLEGGWRADATVASALRP